MKTLVVFCCGTLVLLGVLIFVFAPYSTASTVQLGDFEQLVLRTPSALYDGYVLDSVSSPALTSAAVYATSLATARLPTRNETQTVQIGSGLFQFFAFDLLPGSAVAVDWAFERALAPVELVVIVGAAQFKSWSAGGEVPIQYQISRYEGAYTYTYTQQPSADVYFVFNNENFKAASGVANFTIDAVVYDVQSQKPVSTCTVFPCVVDPLLEDQMIVIQGLADGTVLNTERTIQYHVIGRVGLYFSIVGGTIGGIVCLIVAGCVAKKLARRTTYAALDESPTAASSSSYVKPVYSPPEPAPEPTPTPGAAAYQPPVSPEFDEGPAPSAPAL